MASEGRRVLVTGVAGDLGAALAARLERDERTAYVAGLDLEEPAVPLERTEHIRADLRNPLAGRVVESTRVDTVVHLGIATTPQEAGGRARMKELNVIGTMQLLGAAQKAERVQRVVLRSSTAVYGASPRDPAVFDETHQVDVSRRHGYAKDVAEVEAYARAFGRRRGDVDLTILRLANLVGPEHRSPLISYLGLPAVPTVAGYDPRLQVVHVDDVVEVLARSALERHPGIYNVAGPGTAYLSQIIRMAGKAEVPVPGPLVSALSGVLRRSGRVDFSPEQLDFLMHGRVVDLRRLQETFGHRPRWSTREAIVQLVDDERVRGGIDAARVEELERTLAGLAAGRLGGTGRRAGGTGVSG